METPSAVLRAAILLEKQPVTWRRAHGGYTPAERWLVDFADGTSCFVKAAVNGYTASNLRAEYNLIYSRLEAPFLAKMLAWEDDDVPLLVLEDLSADHWPPPWTRTQVDAVLRTLDAIHAVRLPGLRNASLDGILEQGTWASVAEDPSDFLRLGLCTANWLTSAASSLIEAERLGEAACAGQSLCHFDVRSDNLCIAGDRVIVVDWNFACQGNGDFDKAFWLPSLQAEGGPSPDELMPDAPHWAAAVSGFFAGRAGLPMIPDAPRVRAVQLAQLKTALPWAQSALGLPPLDGPNAL
jgi:hypothetical protein